MKSFDIECIVNDTIPLRAQLIVLLYYRGMAKQLNITDFTCFNSASKTMASGSVKLYLFFTFIVFFMMKFFSDNSI